MVLGDVLLVCMGPMLIVIEDFFGMRLLVYVVGGRVRSVLVVILTSEVSE